VVSATFPVDLNGNMPSKPMDVTCPARHVVMGGGFEVVGNLPISALASLPVAGNGWRVVTRLNQITAVRYSVNVYAICASVN
jgi:hypothetical protein